MFLWSLCHCSFSAWNVLQPSPPLSSPECFTYPSLLALQSLSPKAFLFQVQSPSLRGCPVPIIQALVCKFGFCLSHLLQGKPHGSRIPSCSCLPSASQDGTLNLAQIWTAMNTHLINNLVKECTLPSEFFWITFMVKESPPFPVTLHHKIKGSQMINCDHYFYQGYFGDCIFITSNANPKGCGWKQGGNVYLLITGFHGRNSKWLMVNNKKTVGNLNQYQPFIMAF